MQIGLFVVVEMDGATFRFGSADKAMLALAAWTKERQDAARAKLRDAGPLDDVAFEDAMALALVAETTDPEAAGLLAGYFTEAVRGWDGVEDEDGKPIKFSTEAAREFPFEIKAELAAEALNKRSAAMQKKGRPG